MNKKQLKEYKETLEPWVPGGDVTMVDVVVSGDVEQPVHIVDAAIIKMIAS